MQLSVYGAPPPSASQSTSPPLRQIVWGPQSSIWMLPSSPKDGGLLLATASPDSPLLPPLGLALFGCWRAVQSKPVCTNHMVWGMILSCSGEKRHARSLAFACMLPALDCYLIPPLFCVAIAVHQFLGMLLYYPIIIDEKPREITIWDVEPSFTNV